jgi:glucokinase
LPADLNPCAIGCDLGGTRLKIAVLRGNRVLAKTQLPVPAAQPETILTAIESALGAALCLTATATSAALARRRSSFRGRRAKPSLGFAVPGFLDLERRRILFLSHLPSLNGLPLAERLERRFRGRIARPVVLDADSNAGAYAEALLGAGKSFQRVLYLTLGTGLGAALIAGGEVVRVSNHTVGQAAHLPLGEAGPRCTCGKTGCAEALLAAKGLSWRAKRRGLEETDPEAVFKLAAGGSRAARQVFQELGADLGKLLALLANLFSPEVLVIGGGLSRAAPLFLPEARKTFERAVHPRRRGQVEVRAGRLSPYAGAIGAALLSRKK